LIPLNHHLAPALGKGGLVLSPQPPFETGALVRRALVGRLVVKIDRYFNLKSNTISKNPHNSPIHCSPLSKKVIQFLKIPTTHQSIVPPLRRGARGDKPLFPPYEGGLGGINHSWALVDGLAVKIDRYF
jgi:hypothetical protein